VLFEVPTGVIADTIGRKASYLLGIGTLLIATLLYVASAEYGWGIWAFVGASILLGFGFTCQTGAVDAWLVDALNYLKYEGLHEQVFARAGMVSGAAMLIGTLAGGFLGQVNLSVPYLVRSGILALAFVFVVFGMHEVGFRPRPLKWGNFGAETRTIFNAGIHVRLATPGGTPAAVRLGRQGVFMLYFFYSMAPFALDLLGRPDLVWVAGVLAAFFGLAGIIGNTLVGPVMRSKNGRRRAPSRARGMAALTAVAAALIGIIGLLTPEGGSLVSFGSWWVSQASSGVCSSASWAHPTGVPQRADPLGPAGNGALGRLVLRRSGRDGRTAGPRLACPGDVDTRWPPCRRDLHGDRGPALPEIGTRQRGAEARRCYCRGDILGGVTVPGAAHCSHLAAGGSSSR
jgi:MFS family permease